MPKHGLVAFTATVTILAPIVVPRLTAGPKQEAMAFAPAYRSLVVDGVGVETSFEQVIADTGETIQLHLEADRKVVVGIVMLGSTGTEGGRVPDPPLGLLYKTVTIDAPDGERVAKDVPIKLAGAVARNDAFASYTVYVTTPAEAKRLDRLQRHATGPVEPDEPGPPEYSTSGYRLEEALMAMNRDVEPDEIAPVDKQFPIGTVARLDAVTRPRYDGISLAMPEVARPNQPFEVDVTVANPTNERMDDVSIGLEPPSVTVDYRGIDPKDYVVEPQRTSLSLAPHETRRVKFEVTAKTVGALALVATSWATSAVAFGATEVTDEIPAPRYVLGTR